MKKAMLTFATVVLTAGFALADVYQVKSSNGQTLSNAKVKVYCSAGNLTQTARTDAYGRVRVSARNGSYTIKVNDSMQGTIRVDGNESVLKVVTVR